MNPLSEQEKAIQQDLADIYRSLARHFAGVAEAYKQLQKHEETRRTHT